MVGASIEDQRRTRTPHLLGEDLAPLRTHSCELPYTLQAPSRFSRASYVDGVADLFLLGWPKASANVKCAPGPFVPLTESGIPDAFKRCKRELPQTASVGWPSRQWCCASVPHGPAVPLLYSLVSAVHGQHDRVCGFPPAESWMRSLCRETTVQPKSRRLAAGHLLRHARALASVRGIHPRFGRRARDRQQRACAHRPA